MNERIFELIQAQNWFSGLVWTEQDKQEFAELLIRECYEWAKENGGLGTEYDYNALKEHFGVE